MDRIETQILLAVTAIAAASVLAILYCAACAVRNHHREHDLKVKVNVLRNQMINRKNSKQGTPIAGEYEVVK